MVTGITTHGLWEVGSETSPSIPQWGQTLCRFEWNSDLFWRIKKRTNLDGIWIQRSLKLDTAFEFKQIIHFWFLNKKETMFPGWRLMNISLEVVGKIFLDVEGQILRLRRLLQRSICEVMDTCVRVVVVIVWAWTEKIFWSIYQNFEIYYWKFYGWGKICSFLVESVQKRIQNGKMMLIWKVIKLPN